MESKFNRTVYVVEGLEIAEMSYREYLETNWNDNTTTPEGVANRTQVRAIILDSDGELVAKSDDANDLNPEFYIEEEEVDEDGDVIRQAYTPKVQWGTFTWSGAHGSGPLRWNWDVYDTEEEACDEILRGFESDYHTLSRNVPACCDTIDDAHAIIAESRGKSRDVVARYIAFKGYCERVQEERNNAYLTKEHERVQGLVAIYAGMIEKKEGESYAETCARLGAAVGERIESKVFYKAVNKIRSK
jgi:hypothetical protein